MYQDGITCIGPEFMRSFAENEDILQKFTEVALKQPCLPRGTHVDCNHNDGKDAMGE